MPSGPTAAHLTARHRVTAEIRRAAWLSAAALLAIAATVVVLAALQRSTHRAVEHSRDVARLGRFTVLLLGDSHREFRESIGRPSGMPPPGPFAAQPALRPALDSLVAATTSPERTSLARRMRDAVLAWDRTPGSSETLFVRAHALGDSLIGGAEREYATRLRRFDLVQDGVLAAVCVEVLVVIIVLSRLTGRIVAQAEGLEDQSAGLAAAATDAEASRRRAEAMAQQKARLAAILDAALSSAPIGFAFFDEQLRFLRVNPWIAELNGMAPEDHIGLTLREAAPAFADNVEPMLVRTLATRNVSVNVPAERRHPDGTSSHYLSNFFPIVTEDGEVLGVGGTVIDVTDRRRLEAQLQHAQKMDAIGRLAGGITHDFNNLLTVIGTSAELIALNEDVKESAREVGEIRKAVERAAALTRQLLAFSRRQPMSPRIVNPNEIIVGMQDLLRRLLLAGVQIRTELTADPHVVRVDPGQLEQVIMNLTINAADAMPHGGMVTIGTANVVLPQGDAPVSAEPGAYVAISVKDTGHGMDAAVLERIFEPFFTTKGPGRGTGLGLATVYGIVRQSGGDVAVSSRPGLGSTFTVYLPATA